MVAISTLLLVVAVSLLLTRVATVILIATGMSREQARFQARSAFSTAGFTTSESEKVVNHPIRRRVVMTLMLLGSAGTVAVISTLILGFGSHAGGGRRWWRILELVLGLLALVWFSRSRWVDRRLTNVIRAVLGRFTDLDDRDRASLLDLAADYAVNELSVAEGDWLAGRTLAELDLRHEGAVVLGITRVSGSYDPVPSGETRVVPGDTLIVYGPGRLLRELDVRRAGPEGDRAHELAVGAHRRDKQAVTASSPSQPGGRHR